jgi:hypothetical protein
MDANVCTCALGSLYSKNRFGPLHDGWLFTWSQKGLLLSSDHPHEGNIGGSVGNEMEYAPILTNLSTQRRVGVYTNLNLD